MSKLLKLLSILIKKKGNKKGKKKGKRKGKKKDKPKWKIPIRRKNLTYILRIILDQSGNLVSAWRDGIWTVNNYKISWENGGGKEKQGIPNILRRAM